MSTRVTHDITKHLQVRYCLHGTGEFQMTGQLRERHEDADYFDDLTLAQARELRACLDRWIGEAEANADRGGP